MSGEYYGIGEGAKPFSDLEHLQPATAHEHKPRSDDPYEGSARESENHMEYLKEIYSKKERARTPIPKTRFLAAATHQRTINEATPGGTPSEDSETKRMVYYKRQNSSAIETDHSGAAVNTINNILNGITDSVNRLSELRVHLDSPINDHGDGPVKGKVVRLKGSDSGDAKRDADQKKKKKRLRESTSKQSNTKYSKMHVNLPQKGIKSSNYVNKLGLEKASAVTVNKGKVMKRLKTAPKAHKLVEIYHNIAAKESESDDSHGFKKSRRESKMVEENVPPLNIEKPEQMVEKEKSRFYYQEPQAPREELNISKNYELPTIASRMKQVAKCYLNAFNFKAIPFCAATSTSPSHNIGINIQQVMNIIKTKQPMQGISPTLAHNIGLAAERLNSRPLTGTLGSKPGYNSQCPLGTNLNMNHLQELAKEIDEGNIVEEECPDSPAVKTVIITGPTGEVEVKNRKEPVWTSTGFKMDNCTCLSPKTNTLQSVVKKFESQTPLTAQNSAKPKKMERKPKVVRRAKAPEPKPKVEAKEKTDDEDTPLHGKEKNLKDVLTNLHDEFDYMNKRYEELSKAAQDENEDSEVGKELAKMEKDLSNKEEEITMVMGLYKEVLALKKQVKTLKQRTSQGSISVKEGQSQNVKFSEYNNPQAAFHLTKLLKQIQHYQTHCKKEVPPC